MLFHQLIFWLQEVGHPIQLHVTNLPKHVDRLERLSYATQPQV